MAGTLLRFTGATRGLRISWLTVGIKTFLFLSNSCLKPVRAPGGSIFHARIRAKHRSNGFAQETQRKHCCFLQAGNVSSLVERTLFEENSEARRFEKENLTSAQTRRLLTPSRRIVNPKAAEFGLGARPGALIGIICRENLPIITKVPAGPASLRSRHALPYGIDEATDQDTYER
jgi:hypothetical protein